MSGPCKTNSKNFYKSGVPEEDLVELLDRLDEDGWEAEYELVQPDEFTKSFTVTATKEVCACRPVSRRATKSASSE